MGFTSPATSKGDIESVGIENVFTFSVSIMSAVIPEYLGVADAL